MSKKLFFCIVIIILIIAGIYTANTISKKDQTVKTATNTTKETNETDRKNTVANNTVNDVDKQEIENETSQGNVSKAETKEEQAKEIVKKNWGEDDSVYYSYDGIDNNGRYIICVRDKATTKALFWYYVDIETGTFDIE